MKKLVLIVMLFLVSLIGYSQKFAFVDTEYILGRIPTYRSAQEQLDRIAAQYQSELEEKYQEIEKLFKDFQTEKILLTEEMKRKREENLMAKEREAKELQMRYFGRDGMLFKKREELVKPIQDQVFNAVKEIATEGGFAVIFDAAASPNMLYTNPRYDKSDEVLQKLGYN